MDRVRSVELFYGGSSMETGASSKVKAVSLSLRNMTSVLKLLRPT